MVLDQSWAPVCLGFVILNKSCFSFLICKMDVRTLNLGY